MARESVDPIFCRHAPPYGLAWHRAQEKGQDKWRKRSWWVWRVGGVPSTNQIILACRALSPVRRTIQHHTSSNIWPPCTAVWFGLALSPGERTLSTILMIWSKSYAWCFNLILLALWTWKQYIVYIQCIYRTTAVKCKRNDRDSVEVRKDRESRISNYIVNYATTS